MSFYEHDQRLVDSINLVKKLREQQEEAKQKYIKENQGKPLSELMLHNLMVRDGKYESPLTENEKLLLYYIESKEDRIEQLSEDLAKYEDAVRVIRGMLRIER